ncbi:MAG: serine hydrolase domain-containing protein [Acidobacteriota bacterium]
MHRRSFLLFGAGAGLYAGPLEDRIRRIEQRWLPVTSMAGDRVPAVSMAVFHDGQIEWARAYGVATTTGTLFQAASLSKPLAAMAALHMAQHGNFGLDDNVNTKLKSWQVPDNEFTATAKVTVRGILSHTAGLTVPSFPGYDEDDEVPSVLEILDGKLPARTLPVRVSQPPGAQFLYSGGGYTVLQVLLEDRFGKAFPELMRRIVLQRLSLYTSTFEQPLPAESAARAAVGFHQNGRSYTGGWHTYPELAAAGLWTTPIDLAKFALEVQNTLAGKSAKVLEKSAAALMVTPHLGAYGLGVETRPGWFGPGGANAGYRCRLWAARDGSHGAAVMTNSDNGAKLVDRIFAAIAAESSWPAGLA